jgi:hypothetical protein
MTSFLHFLYYECASIKAFVEEAGQSDTSENITMETASNIFLLPQREAISAQLNEGGEGTKEEHIKSNLCSWPLSLRLAIIKHLINMEIDISLLMDVVEKYRFDLEIEELIEIVRALDILGAEMRLSEYEATLYMTLGEEEIQWEKRGETRLPVSFFDHVSKFKNYPIPHIIGRTGSQRLIEFFLVKNNDEQSHIDIFTGLCAQGHLSLAQWFYSTRNVPIHAWNESAFRWACEESRLSIAQWLYSLGDVNIHIDDDYSFVAMVIYQ